MTLSPTLMPHAMSRRILIVEDERRLREMLHQAVLEMGLVPTTAASGESVVKLLEHGEYALALVDLNLPGMSGLDLCDRLHRCDPPVQVVILTGFGDLDAARRAIRLQVVDFLTKPCSMGDLESALCRARLRWLDHWNGVEARTETPPPEFDDDSDSSELEPPPQLENRSNEVKSSSIDVVERELITAALERHNGNREAVAEELGISIRKLYYRLRQYQQNPR